MSAAQQIKTFQEAQVIVAPVSSALMNTVFCQSGTQIIVLAQRGVFNWTLYCAWMAERGCGVVFVCGPDESERKHDDYSISVDDLDKALAETEAS
jgi:capsular polysaccharide biosynthesis protein